MTLNSAFLWASQNVEWAMSILVALLVAVWKLAQWTHRPDDTEIDNRESRRSIEELKGSKTTPEGILVASKESKVEDEITSVAVRIARAFANMLEERELVHESAPLSLNDKGEDIACRIEADAIVECYIDSILEDTKGMDAYDVQEFCFEFGCYEMKQDLKDRHAKHYARVSRVADETGFAIESILRKAVGIKLRDKVLQRQGEVV